MATPLLGWIEPHLRTSAQQDAHADALASMPKFNRPPIAVPRGTKVLLTDLWKHPDVVRDIGTEFPGFHQLTGSCVGASEGNCVATLAAAQRVLADDAKKTRAFVPFWPFPYGRTRYNEGDRGEGEGAMDSVMGLTLEREGVFAITETGLPHFSADDGLYLTKQVELQWSNGGNSSLFSKWSPVAKPHTMRHASLDSPEQIKTSILGGEPVLYGCSMYIGHGQIKGVGDLAYVAGRYDGNGGHSTCFLGYWEHPSDGPLYLYSNQWPTSTYPRDPAGGGRCTVWTTEAQVQYMLDRLGGRGGETMALSSLLWDPAWIDRLLDWSQL